MTASINAGLGSATFSDTAWGIIKGSRDMANKRGSTAIEAIDLLASLSKSETPEGKALVANHADYGHVLIYAQCRQPKTLAFNEADPRSNFTSEARDVLGTAFLIADQRGKAVADEHDLVEALVNSNYSPQAIQNVLKSLEVNLPTFWQAISTLSI